MKITIHILISILILQSCVEKNNNAIYNIDPKPRDVILLNNEKYIKNPEALELFTKGLKKIASKNYKKAKELFLKANKIENNNIVILDALASVESHLGNNRQSINMFYKNMRKDSIQVNTYINLGQILMLERRYEEANKILMLGLKNGEKVNLDQKPGLLLNLAISFNNLQQCDKGLKYANQALEISQNNEFSKFARGIIQESKNCIN